MRIMKNATKNKVKKKSNGNIHDPTKSRMS